jgi:thiamine pyrophosphokinase
MPGVDFSSMTREELSTYQEEERAKLMASRQEQRDAELENERLRLRGAYLSGGGGGETFDAHWPELRHQIVAKRATETDRAAHERAAADTRSRF